VSEERGDAEENEKRFAMDFLLKRPASPAAQAVPSLRLAQMQQLREPLRDRDRPLGARSLPKCAGPTGDLEEEPRPRRRLLRDASRSILKEEERFRGVSCGSHAKSFLAPRGATRSDRLGIARVYVYGGPIRQWLWLARGLLDLDRRWEMAAKLRRAGY